MIISPDSDGAVIKNKKTWHSLLLKFFDNGLMKERFKEYDRDGSLIKLAWFISFSSFWVEEDKRKEYIFPSI